MKYIWSLMVLISIAAGAGTGRADNVLMSGLTGAVSAFETSFKLAGMMCFWSGILSLLSSGGIMGIIEKILSPVFRRIFGKSSASGYISMNVAANLFGMGNAATPSGLMAMERLDSENGSEKPSRAMALFAVMNTASLQIVPSTVASMRTAAGAAKPFDIMPAVWITSMVSLTVSVIAVLVMFRKDA